MPETLAGRFLDWEGFPFHEPWFRGRWHVARYLRDRWDRICRETFEAEQLAEFHAARGDIKAVFDRYLALLKDCLALLELTQRMTDRNGPVHHAQEQVARELTELTRLDDEIFQKWQTVEDLAAMLIEKFPLTSTQLDELAKRSQPPQSWYDEEFDPFTPDAPG